MYPKFEEVNDALTFDQYELDDQLREILKPTWYWTGINMSFIALSIALLTTNWLMSLVLVSGVVWSIVQHARVRKRMRTEYEQQYRTLVVKPTLHSFEKAYKEIGIEMTCEYVADGALHDDIIDASPLAMYKGHMRSSDDYISGTYRQLPYKGAVVTLYKDTVEDTVFADPYMLVAFEGTVLYVELPVACHGTHRIISGVFIATDWKTTIEKQVSLVAYKALLKQDEQLKQLEVTAETDVAFQARFKVHTNDEEELRSFLNEHVQKELLTLFPVLRKHDVSMQLLIKGKALYIVLQRNRYVAEERMHLALDDEQLHSIYAGLMLQLRVIEAFHPAIASMKKTSEP
ncbi:DUF3137 domain-containing protein [Caryophanon latum]|uniref:DUF3137 domain-containing protein n=1 Tax=Caryophanon latum TaxID=33977 RepID=A0A1C0Z2A3_9BACL|nr:DUF3137 domain-containing protein [Caryophanon latum]OCS93533.1 hypothetical protein A6K76_05175 [Caryophanon latum]